MKRILSIAILCLLPLAASAQGLTAEGVVINAVDGNGLPLCVVQLKQDGAIKARAVTDYAGRYMLQSVVQGVYDIVVVQFGDTLCRYRGLTLERNTLIRHYVQPPAGVESEPTIDYALGVRLLRPATVSVRVKNMLGQMVLLINNPDDPRLWNFSGRMDSFEDLDISFWYSQYKLFYKLRKLGYNITSPFELIYPEIYHPASDSNAVDYKIWVLGIKIK